MAMREEGVQVQQELMMVDTRWGRTGGGSPWGKHGHCNRRGQVKVGHFFLFSAGFYAPKCCWNTSTVTASPAAASKHSHTMQLHRQSHALSGQRTAVRCNEGNCRPA